MDRDDISVVIIDGNSMIRGVLRQIITGAGHMVVGEAANAAAALDLVRRLQPRVVTLDIHLPDRPGLELLPDLMQVSPKSYVLVVTGDGDQALARRAFELGAIGFVVKPVSAQRILSLFDNLASLSKRTMHRSEPTVQRSVDAKRCVVADDNRSMLLYLKAILESAGIEVVAEAADGMEALAAVERCQPDLLCLDIDMPNIDGLNALTCLRAVHPTLPVVMVTAHTDRDTVTVAINLKVQGYLLKPFDPDKVVTLLRKIGMAK